MIYFTKIQNTFCKQAIHSITEANLSALQPSPTCQSSHEIMKHCYLMRRSWDVETVISWGDQEMLKLLSNGAIIRCQNPKHQESSLLLHWLPTSHISKVT